jgi:hypothetical protein
MTFLVGYSGWSYDDWVDAFYPVEMANKKGKWFDYYARFFRTTTNLMTAIYKHLQHQSLFPFRYVSMASSRVLIFFVGQEIMWDSISFNLANFWEVLEKLCDIKLIYALFILPSSSPNSHDSLVTNPSPFLVSSQTNIPSTIRRILSVFSARVIS